MFKVGDKLFVIRITEKINPADIGTIGKEMILLVDKLGGIEKKK